MVTTTAPDPEADWWTTKDIAAYLGLHLSTISAYRQRGQMPAPDQTVGRLHMWKPVTILEWQAGRPRPGVGGRPAIGTQTGEQTE